MHRNYAMQTHIVNGSEILIGSDNVFADLELPDAKSLKIKTGLIAEIMRSMRRLVLNQSRAARRMDIPEPDLSALLRGDLDLMSEHELMECLNRLGCDIEIRVQPAQQTEGRVKMVSAGNDTPVAAAL